VAARRRRARRGDRAARGQRARAEGPPGGQRPADRSVPAVARRRGRRGLRLPIPPPGRGSGSGCRRRSACAGSPRASGGRSPTWRSRGSTG
jgi:hypothetical protein